MKAILQSARIAPKKANIIVKMVRGMPVEAAITLLENTHKKGARFVEKLIKSAMANASHNDKQDVSQLVVKTIFVTQGQGMRRGVPMARGRVRPMTKFFSHIRLELGVKDQEEKKTKKASAKASASVDSKPAKKKETAKKDSSSSASSHSS